MRKTYIWMLSAFVGDRNLINETSSQTYLLIALLRKGDINTSPLFGLRKVNIVKYFVIIISNSQNMFFVIIVKLL